MPIQVSIALLLLINLHLLGTSRLNALIRAVAWQAFLICALGALVNRDVLEWHGWLVIVTMVIVKSIVLPMLMRRALRETAVRREIEPLLGYAASLFAGIILLAVSMWGAWRLPLPNAIDPLMIGSAFFTFGVGLLLIVSRIKAITQAIGYLIMENGIYLFGLAAAAGQPLIIEMGVLLDVFVGVFIMGIMVFNINREFEHIDTHQLAILKD